MLNHNHDPISQLQIVQHAEVSRYMTLVGFTVVFWDHACTFGDEVQFLWTAPKSFVKILFLGNRYIALACMALAACQTSRLVHMSDTVYGLVAAHRACIDGCIASILVLGCFEMVSLAIWDLLLLFRVHALWCRRRRIVVGTSVLYCITYVGHAVAGIVGGTQLIPHLYFDPLANTCTADYRPSIYSMLWAFPLFCETIMFILTIIKVLEDRKSEQFNHPLMKSLYYGQIIYNVVIIVVRVFNIVIYSMLPPSFLFLGVYFIWAMITALVTRMMLHLRRAAASDSQQSQETLFGETAVSTRIAWARHPSVMESSRTAFSPNPRLAGGHGNVDWSNGDGERGGTIEMQSYRTDRIPTDDHG